MTKKKVLVVDDSPVSGRVVKALERNGHSARMKRGLSCTDELDGYDLLVLDPAMPSSRPDLKPLEVQCDAVDLLASARSRHMKSVVFSVLSEPMLVPVMEEAGSQWSGEKIYSKRRPSDLVKYVDEL